MGGKAVQLVQGRDKAIEEDSPLDVLHRFRSFPEIQVIDLDAAMSRGANDELVEVIARKAVARVGGGIRSLERARRVIDQGAHRIIVGTSAFDENGVSHPFLAALAEAVGPEKVVIALDSKDGKIVVRAWRQSIGLTAEAVMRFLDPYCGGYLCTYVDKEGMMEGTDLEWFRRLRESTSHEITAAGGVTTLEDIQALHAMNVHAAVGMAIYTGRLDLRELEALVS